MNILNPLRNLKHRLLGKPVSASPEVDTKKNQVIFSTKRGEKSKRAMMVYLVEPFLESYNPDQERIHANRWRSRAIVDILEEFDFAVDVTDWKNQNPIEQKNYDLIFGLGSLYCEYANAASPKTTKIYFGTGTHSSQTNGEQLAQIFELNERRGIELTPNLLDNDNGPELSDAIFVVGNGWVSSTYDGRTEAPRYLIRNSMVVDPDQTFELDSKDYQSAKNKFLWMAGYGAIRRRLDLVLEAFSKVPECELWVCGGIRYERDFFKAYHKELNETPNINYEGWTDVGSEDYQRVTSVCGYMIYPSTSDGSPGSVVNAMACGVVPLVTEETGIDTGGFGELVEDTTVDGLVALIKKCSEKPANELKEESIQVAKFTRETYTKEEFIRSFRESLKDFLETQNSNESHAE